MRTLLLAALIACVGACGAHGAVDDDDAAADDDGDADAVTLATRAGRRAPRRAKSGLP